MYELYYGSEIFYYTIVYKANRKKLSIQIDGPKITVIAPENTPLEKIQQLMDLKKDWIKKQFLLIDQSIDQGLKRKFVSGEKLPYLGREYRLKITTIDAKPISFYFYKGIFHAIVPTDLKKENYRAVLYPLYKEWIHERGMTIIHKRVRNYTNLVGEEPTAIEIIPLKTRWGSCTKNKAIYFNWHIFLAPMSIVDYVIAHEVVHLKYLDHSKEYWQTLDRLYPHYEDAKDWLTINGQRLYI